MIEIVTDGLVSSAHPFCLARLPARSEVPRRAAATTSPPFLQL